MNRHTVLTSPRRLLVTAAVAAVSAATLTVPTLAAPAEAAAAPSASAVTAGTTAERRVSKNLSSNPVLRKSHRGYRAVSGARAVKRVKVAKKIRSARYAASATVTSTTTRVALPRTKVAPDQLVRASADVKATSGRGAHISISWFDSAGRFLSWSGGEARSTSGAKWTRVAAELRAPAKAAVGETVVNVLDSKRGTKVYITNHVFRAVTEEKAVVTPAKPTPTPTPDPAPSAPVTPSAPATEGSPVRLLDNSRMIPGAVIYGDPRYATPFAKEGALVIAGRTNYDSAEMKSVSAAGGTVLVYLDALVDNAYGRYSDMLFNPSKCGGAVPRWPGEPRVSEWGYLTDFRPGSVLQGKLECVLETIVSENPHIGGFFADDLGSRSWFPGINWNTFGSANQVAYRNGAVELSKTFRKVADRHGLFVMVNGTWEGGSVAAAGGGYPDASQHGNALADGTMSEYHVADGFWGSSYPCAPQWAKQSKTTNGKPFNFAVTTEAADLPAFGRTGCYAFGTTQRVYDSAPVWGAFGWTGLPIKVNTAG